MIKEIILITDGDSNRVDYIRDSIRTVTNVPIAISTTANWERANLQDMLDEIKHIKSKGALIVIDSRHDTRRMVNGKFGMIINTCIKEIGSEYIYYIMTERSLAVAEIKEVIAGTIILDGAEFVKLHEAIDEALTLDEQHENYRFEDSEPVEVYRPSNVKVASKAPVKIVTGKYNPLLLLL